MVIFGFVDACLFGGAPYFAEALTTMSGWKAGITLGNHAGRVAGPPVYSSLTSIPVLRSLPSFVVLSKAVSYHAMDSIKFDDVFEAPKTETVVFDGVRSSATLFHTIPKMQMSSMESDASPTQHRHQVKLKLLNKQLVLDRPDDEVGENNVPVPEITILREEKQLVKVSTDVPII